MKNLVVLGLGLALLFAVSGAGAARQVMPGGADIDRKAQAEIEARDPEGAALFAKATEARDRNDDAAVVELLGQVRERDPWFSTATRRLCGMESDLGHHERAVVLCREAYAADASGRSRTS